MSTFRAPGTLLLSEALGRAMREWSHEAWERMQPDAREFFDGAVQLQGFQLIALANQAAVQETYSRLRTILSQGGLPSHARVPQGAPVPIPAGAWQSGAADRLADVLAGRVRLAGPDSAGDVLISTSDLDAALAGRVAAGPATPAPAAQDSQAALSVDRGGARKRFDDVDFLIEAFRILYDGNIPPSRAEHARLALEAFADRHPSAGTPSAEYAKPLIQRLWKALELERRDARKAG